MNTIYRHRRFNAFDIATLIQKSNGSNNLHVTDHTLYFYWAHLHQISIAKTLTIEMAIKMLDGNIMQINGISLFHCKQCSMAALNEMSSDLSCALSLWK